MVFLIIWGEKNTNLKKKALSKVYLIIEPSYINTAMLFLWSILLYITDTNNF